MGTGDFSGVDTSADYNAFLLNPKLLGLASICKKILVLNFLVFVRNPFFR
jgi:hypothetical protein